MPAQLHAAAMSVAGLLEHFSKFSVPDYQRAYGWTESQLERLFSDLQAAMQRRARPGGSPPLFYLGTIYLAADQPGDEAQIADGQQRILTATMLYCAARDLCEDAAEASRLHNVLLQPGSGTRFRFSPRNSDADFFRRWVQERGATLLPMPIDDPPLEEDEENDAAAALPESQQHIIRNRDAIVEKLRQLGPEGRKRLLEFHETAINVIVISMPQLGDARNAYASTQTRGLRQAETDKLKAEFIGDCPPPERSRLASQWDDCEGDLGKEHMAELFEHLIVIEGERKVQHALEADLAQVFDLPKNVAHFIDNVLAPSARAYKRILDVGPGRKRGQRSIIDRRQRRIDEHLISLLRTTHTAWKAPAILALRDLAGDQRRMEGVLRDLERLAAVVMLIPLDPHQAIVRYIAVIKDLKGKSKARQGGLKVGADELHRARAALTDRNFATRERLCMPVLLKANDLVGKKVVALQPKLLSCEHILPKNPSRRSHWYRDFKDHEGKYVGGEYLHTLGNVTILTPAENVEADRRAFAFKSNVLKRSSFPLARDAGRNKSWTPKVVRARADRLGKLVIAHWRLDRPD
jgi:hypothetical protein